MIRPLGKNVLIVPFSANKETTTASGIVLPHGEKTGAARARVVAIAKGVEGVEENDVILYEKHAPTVEAGEGRLIVSVDYIMAVLA